MNETRERTRRAVLSSSSSRRPGAVGVVEGRGEREAAAQASHSLLESEGPSLPLCPPRPHTHSFAGIESARARAHPKAPSRKEDDEGEDAHPHTHSDSKTPMALARTPIQSRPRAGLVLPLLLLLSVVSAASAASSPANSNTTTITRRSFFVPLAVDGGNGTTVLPLLARPTESAPQGLTFTLLLPPEQQPKNNLPLIFLLNGANVEARWYAQLASRLAAAGFPVALSDSYRRVPVPFRNTSTTTTTSSCPGPNFALAPSAGAVQSFLRAAEDGGGNGGGAVNEANAATSLLRDLRLRERGIVLLGHSFGGAVSSLLLGGRCAPRQKQQAASTTTPTNTTTTTTPTTNSTSLIDEFAFLCGGWQPSQRDLAIIKGAVLLEGYPSSPGRSGGASPAGFSPTALDLTARREAGVRVEGGGSDARQKSNPFVLFLQGEFNGRVRAAYDASAEAVVVAANGGANNKTNVSSPSSSSSSTCVAYARFRGLNHYLGTDWVEPSKAGGGGFGGGQNATSTNNNASRQITPCGAPASNDPASFSVTKEVQERGTARIAELIEAVIKAQVFADVGAERALGRVVAGAAGAGAAKNGTTTANVPPGDAAEVLYAGDGCMFGGGGMTTKTTTTTTGLQSPPPPKRR